MRAHESFKLFVGPIIVSVPAVCGILATLGRPSINGAAMTAEAMLLAMMALAMGMFVATRRERRKVKRY